MYRRISGMRAWVWLEAISGVLVLAAALSGGVLGVADTGERVFVPAPGTDRMPGLTWIGPASMPEEMS